MKDINFIIMIEPGKLEWQGIMLIESLYENCEDNFAINVYCSRDKVSGLSSVVQQYLKKSDINVEPIDSDFTPYYPHGNKIIAAAMEREEAKYGIFMDSDMLLLKKTKFSDEFDKHSGDVYVVRAGLDKWSNNEADWLVAYSEANTKPYSEKIKLANGRDSFPYFNAGLVAFTEKSDFKQAWKDVASKLDVSDKVGNKRPWLDQVALPIAIKKCGLSYSLLDPCFNYGLNNDYNDLSKALVGHYHTKKWLYHHGLNNIMRRYTRESVGEKNFAVLVNKTENREPDHEVKLYGAFRSGTNFLKTITEWNYNARVYYDAVEWKHGFVPTKEVEKHSRYKVIVLSKNPFSALWSLYKYKVENNKNIICSLSWENFLYEPFIVRNDFQENSPEYYFKNPVAYWESVYWSYMSVQSDNWYHIRYEDLLENPKLVLTEIYGEKGLLREENFLIPEKKVKNMGDAKKQSQEEYLRTNYFDNDFYKNKKYLEGYSDEQISFVVNNISADLLNKMGYSDVALMIPTTQRPPEEVL